MDSLTLLYTAKGRAHRELDNCAIHCTPSFPSLTRMPEESAITILATALLLQAAIHQADSANLRLPQLLRALAL